MSILDEASALLTTSTVAGGATGWPLYLGHLPDSSTIGDKAVGVIHTQGQGYMPRIGLEQEGLQIVVRGAPTNQTSTGYQDAMDRATLIAKAARDYVGTPTSTGARWAGVWNESGPFFAGFDEGWRPLFSSNWRVWREST